jgi:hypothetical protein
MTPRNFYFTYLWQLILMWAPLSPFVSVTGSAMQS